MTHEDEHSKNFIKIGWKLKNLNCLIPPFYVKNSNSNIITLCIFLKGICLRSELNKNPHQKQMNNKLFISIYMYSTFLTPLGPLFLLCNSDQQQKHRLCRGLSHEHSYQVYY